MTKQDVYNIYVETVKLYNEEMHRNEVAKPFNRITKEEMESNILTYKDSIAYMKEQKSVEAYYNTEEGKAHKANLIKEEENLYKEKINIERNVSETIDVIVGELGLNAQRFYTSDSRATLTLMARDEYNQEVIFNDFTLTVEENYGKVRYRMNFGVTGEFDPLNTEKGSRADYYMKIGLLISRKKMLDDIKTIMLNAIKDVRPISKKIDGVYEELRNPIM